MKCSPDEMPAYDYRATINAEMTPQLDSFLRIQKKRDVFIPCRKMIYNAVFNTGSGELISKGRIMMMAKGERWKGQPEKQDEILIQYEYTQKDFDQNEKHQLNRGMLHDRWAGEVTEGIIENVEEVWMHPFRTNQYSFTEVAPFPQIKFPLKLGKSWTGNLSLSEGWGDWANARVASEYKVVKKEDLNIDFGLLKNCWKIESKSKIKLGVTTFDYWFHEEFGFVKMNYKNYGNQTLDIELESIILN